MDLAHFLHQHCEWGCGTPARTQAVTIAVHSSFDTSTPILILQIKISDKHIH